MLKDRMVAAGHVLFRWRSFVLFAFVPFLVWAAYDGEAVEMHWGDLAGDAVELLGILLVALGEAIRIFTVGFVPRGTSGRNTDLGQVAETLNTTGFYSVTRNPLYVGNCLMYLGLALYSQHLWLVVTLGLLLALYYERIIAAEEDFLVGKFGQPYVDWAHEVPPFFPRLSGWRRPALPFSLRTVIRREHASIFGAIAGLYLMELGLHRLQPVPEAVDPLWHWVFGVAVVIDLGVIAIKKGTGWLSVEGR
jgi:protein-S-isoprenylcysteine O-methyltransferase Ste14